MYVVADEIRSRLQIFEQLDKLERKRKDEQEKEMLMRIAKVSIYMYLCYIPNKS